MRRLKAQNKELAVDPPPEFFLGIYFDARKWWSPPKDLLAPEAEPEIPLAATLPEYEP